MVADHTKDASGKISISNITPITIVEGEKRELFIESCLKLVNSIEDNDTKGMQAAYNRMKSQRFSGQAIPNSGVVRCKDNVQRTVHVSTEGSMDKATKQKIVAECANTLRDSHVIVEHGMVVGGKFNNGDKLRLPLTKWAMRKQVARKMRDVAMTAYMSEGFRARVSNLSSLIADGKLEEAVKLISPFLEQNEEFTLLTRAQVRTLVENALATQGIFNQEICNDTATLFNRTNMKVNRTKIIHEWKRVSKRVGSMPLAENVNILSTSKNFEDTMDKFLKHIFETISNREVAAEALATTLESLRDKTPKIKESHDLSSKLNGLINRLKRQDFDDAAIYEAEDLIATIQEELSANENLGNFDQLPGADGGLTGAPDPLSGGEGAGGGGTPPIVINSPLIQIGGTSGAADAGGGDAGLPSPPSDEDLGEEPDDLDALLGGGDPAAGGAPPPPGGAAPAQGGAPPVAPPQPLMQGKNRKEEPISESDDQYAFTGKPITSRRSIQDYGAPVIKDAALMDTIVGVMHRLAKEHKLTGKNLQHNLDDMARVSMEAVGLRLPQAKVGPAIDQLTAAFWESKEPFPGAAPLFGSKSDDDDGDSEDTDDSDDSDDSEEGVAEDQYKYPWIKPRGFKRSSIAKNTPKATNESIQWGERQADAMEGKYRGVNFIFDHGGNNNLDPIIISPDASVEIPIPESLMQSAFAAAKMATGDAKPFLEWLDASIEDLRPISAVENDAIAEAVAKITTGPDGSLSVEVTPDVPVNNIEDGAEEGGMPGMGGEEGMVDDGMGDEAGGMSAVETTAPVDDTAGEDLEDGVEDMAGEEMPDFEGGDEEMAGEEAASGPTPPPPGGAVPPAGGPPKHQGVVEDKDMTNPKSSKYTKYVDEDPRTKAKAASMGESGEDLDEIGPELHDDDGTGTHSPTAGHHSGD